MSFDGSSSHVLIVVLFITDDFDIHQAADAEYCFLYLTQASCHNDSANMWLHCHSSQECGHLWVKFDYYSDLVAHVDEVL